MPVTPESSTLISALNVGNQYRASGADLKCADRHRKAEEQGQCEKNGYPLRFFHHKPPDMGLRFCLFFCVRGC